MNQNLIDSQRLTYLSLLINEYMEVWGTEGKILPLELSLKAVFHFALL